MKRAFVYKDEKSDKFWWINYYDSDFAVNYGKNWVTGTLKNIISLEVKNGRAF